jgi:hypothetical protein
VHANVKTLQILKFAYGKACIYLINKMQDELSTQLGLPADSPEEEYEKAINFKNSYLEYDYS